MNKLIIVIILSVLTICSCGSGSSDVKAQSCGDKDCKIKIHMVHVAGNKSFDFITAEKMTRKAIDFLNSNTTIEIEYSTGVSVPDPRPDTGNINEFGTRNERYHVLRDFFIDNRSIGGNWKKRELTVIVDKPLFNSDGEIYTAGRADICAIYNKFGIAVSYVTPFTNSNPASSSYNRSFEEMFNRGSNIIAHEIGHNLGADHESSNCNFCIMNGNGRPDFHSDIMNFFVSENSNNDMEKCLRRNLRRQILLCERKTLFNIKRRKRCKRKFNLQGIRKRDVAYKGEFQTIRQLQNNDHGEIFGD